MINCISPCFKCDKRVFGCYQSCEAYQVWRAEYDAIQSKKRAENRINNMMSDYVQDRNIRQKRRRGSK